MAITLILGGARSGKSQFAETLVATQGGSACYIATGEARDDEMRARIDHHRARRGSAWQTIEEPLEAAGVVAAHAAADNPILIDCLTLWVSNLMHADRDVDAACDELVAALSRAKGDVTLVANETGLGIVPMNALARAFRDEAGRVNQRVAAAADTVYFMVAGLPHALKKEGIVAATGLPQESSP